MIQVSTTYKLRGFTVTFTQDNNYDSVCVYNQHARYHGSADKSTRLTDVPMQLSKMTKVEFKDLAAFLSEVVRLEALQTKEGDE